MKKLLYLPLVAFLAGSFVACGLNSGKDNSHENDTIVAEQVPDSAIYGIVDESTTMHTLVLNMDDGKQMTFTLDVDTVEADVQGGIFAGDRMTVYAVKGADNTMTVKKAVNLNTLLGKWTSLDRNFQIEENGVINSNSTAPESNPYTQWQMANCNIILNADTFSVLYLGPDSMSLENDKGIFVYKRN